MKGWEIRNFEKEYKLFKKRLVDGFTPLQISRYLQLKRSGCYYLGMLQIWLPSTTIS